MTEEKAEELEAAKKKIERQAEAEWLKEKGEQ